MMLAAVVYGMLHGSMDAVNRGLLDGASSGVTLCIGLCGVTCLWTGVMEVMERSGLSAGLAGLLRPLLVRLFPGHSDDPAALQAISANTAANLLGLGNAATPLGIRAAAAMAQGETATNDLCMLVVLNTASIQLIPATVAGVRAAAGAAAPFDILPAVWLTSAISVTVGILAARLMERIRP